MSFGRKSSSSSSSSSSSNLQTTSVERSYNTYNTQTDSGAIKGMKEVSEKGLTLAGLSMENTRKTALDLIDGFNKRDVKLLESFSKVAGDERDSLVDFIEERQQPDLEFINKMMIVVVGGGAAFLFLAKK